MKIEMLEKIKNGKGFIAALDQSGGSTPKALLNYGVGEDEYKNEDEMFDLVHKMRTRIVKSNSFTGDKIIGAILFEKTMNSEVDGMPTADFLWEKKQVVPFLKIDKGLADEKDGVRLMKEIPNIDERLEDAVKKNIFGTKMRSVINKLSKEGIEEIVAQQFDFAKTIASHGLVPIIEPEITITMDNKAEAEEVLLDALLRHLKEWDQEKPVMFKLTLPEKKNLYLPLYDFKATVRVVALSGGYSREESNRRLAENDRVSASFSRALTEGLNVKMTDEEFDKHLGESIDSIYNASVSSD